MFTFSRKRWLLAVAVLLLLAGGLGAWYFWPDGQLARVKELRQELLSDTSRKLPADQRRQKWQEFRKEEEKLSPGQRKSLWEEMRQRRKKDVEHYFTLTKAEKTRWLDEQIDRREARRREWQAAGGNGAGGGGPGGGQGGGPGGGANVSPEEREKRRKQMLDSTTPEERAQFDQLRKDLAARRSQRGLPGPIFGRP
jgi:hypothetical protein